jgi:hypothetical protein
MEMDNMTMAIKTSISVKPLVFSGCLKALPPQSSFETGRCKRHTKRFSDLGVGIRKVAV